MDKDRFVISWVGIVGAVLLGTVAKGSVDLLLRSKTININQQHLNGNSALLLSILLNPYDLEPKPVIHSSTIRQLLENNANPELTNKDRLTPLEAAQKAEAQNIEGASNAVSLIKEAIENKTANR